MSKKKAMDVDKTILIAKRSISSLLLGICLIILWQKGLLISRFYVPVLLVCNTGFIWYSHQCSGFIDRSGVEVGPEGAGCLLGGGAWFVLIAFVISLATGGTIR